MNGSWPGCETTEATAAGLLTTPNVEHFIHWVNKIHWWGLSSHWPSCQKDVQIFIEKIEKNVRTLLGGDVDDPNADSGLERNDEEDSIHAHIE